MNFDMLRFIKAFFQRLYALRQVIWDKRLKVVIPVRERGKTLFKIYDFGNVTRYRAFSFESKEPETISWISAFGENTSLLDVGANIGIYSLYAACKGVKVVAIEPDALNYALLNLNTRFNSLSESITSYQIAAHNIAIFSKLNISSPQWGGALNSFDTCLDCRGNPFNPIHTQGVFGISLDDFLSMINFMPTHLKLDVDGNENIVLHGALKTLKSEQLTSILIELDTSRSDYRDSLELMEGAGFVLKECGQPPLQNGVPMTLYNHIFYK